MGICNSKLSTKHAEILCHSTGLKAEELCPLFGNIPSFIIHDRNVFQTHNVPNSIAFLVIRGEYIINTKSTFGGRSTYHL
jgi:hypothetical protein